MISFDSKNKTFKLDTPNTSYVIGVVDFDQLVNLYYGDKIADTEGLEARSFRPRCASFSPLTSEYNTDAHDFSPDCAPMEYGCNGCGDFRTSALSIRNVDGNTVTDMRYEGYRIYAGKPSIDPLPAVYLNSESEADTLEIDMADKVTGMRVTLIYTAFNSLDVIIRSARIENASQRPADIDRAMSMCVDLPGMDYDLITLYGRHCKERSEERPPARPRTSGHSEQARSFEPLPEPVCGSRLEKRRREQRRGIRLQSRLQRQLRVLHRVRLFGYFAHTHGHKSDRFHMAS